MRKRGSDDFGQGKKDGEEIGWERGGEIYVSWEKGGAELDVRGIMQDRLQM